MKYFIIIVVLLIMLSASFAGGVYYGRETKKLPNVHEENSWYINKIMTFVPPGFETKIPCKMPDIRLQPKFFKEE